MDRDEALKLLRGDEDGVAEWNRRRHEGEGIPNLCNVILVHAYLSSANLTLADLSGANLSSANLNSADLSSANLCGARLTVADLSDAKLSGAELMRADLSRANLSSAYLNGADLSGADFSGANLVNANLVNANLSYADLLSAKLYSANLSGANLSGANLSGARLLQADLSHADLSHAKLYQTFFTDVDLSKVKSLENIEHNGPSFLGIETIVNSAERIPQPFLEGCGVPDTWITYLPSLIGKAIDFYSCFISYSHQDEEFSKRLHSRMREDKLRVWYAPEDMKAGRKIHEQIDSAIRLHDKLLVVLSEHSMQSEWVANEIREAFKREKQENRRVLFPISLVPFKDLENWKLIDSRTGTDLAEEIRQYFIPDFTNWKDHDAFEASYQRLMKDFKPTPEDG